MFARLDDELIDHWKVAEAGKRLGGKTSSGPAIALAMYAVCLMWTNKHLTDGFIPTATIETFPHFSKPLAVAEALVTARLFEKTEGGFTVHDFDEHNPSARAIKARRKADRIRKQVERASKNGHV
jgi:hypothetical protein